MGNPRSGWYLDPTDDFDRRWWSGSRWTEHVATAGTATTSPPPSDPLAPPLTRRLRAHRPAPAPVASTTRSPVAFGAVVVGAVAAVVALVLPRVQAPGSVALHHVILGRANSSIAVSTIVGAAAMIATAYRSYVTGRRAWWPPVDGAILIATAVLYGIDPRDAHGHPVHGSPGIAVYLTGVAGVLALAGGLGLRRLSSPAGAS